MNIGDTITIPAGKEKDISHAGIPLVVDSINGDKVSLKRADGTILEYTTKDLIVPVQAPNKFPEPKIFEVLVNPDEKVKDAPTAFSFSSPRQSQEEISRPTKIDVQTQRKDPTVQEVLDGIKKEETPKPNSEYSDYYDNAEMLVDAITTGISSFLNWWAQDTALQSYEYPVPTSDKLKRQLTKVLIKRNTMLPIEALCAGTFVGATFPLFIKAKKRRTILQELEAKKTPEEKIADKKATITRRPGKQSKS